MVQDIDLASESDVPDLAPVQSVNGETGDIQVDTALGPLYEESSKTEKVNQWWRLFYDDESFFEDAMSKADQADEVASSIDAMRFVFWTDQI